MKIIKNPSLNRIETTFRGRPIVIKAKGSISCPDGEEGEALFTYLLTTFQFLQDKTPIKVYPVGEIKKARGVKKE